MTLLLTWVAPDGIVMGADSALSWTNAAGEMTMTLSDAYKVIPYDRHGRTFGVSFCGNAKIQSEWTSNWLRQYVATCDVVETIEKFAQQLAGEINAAYKDKELLAFHVAGWEQIAAGADGIEPRFFEVSNVEYGGKVGPYFSVKDILEADFVKDVKTYRGGDTTWYPMRFGSAGVPLGFSTEWITKQFLPAQTKMIGAQLPQPHITSVAEYVRLLIGMVADCQRVARQHATVNRPIETLILFPDRKAAVSTRY